MCRIFFVPLHSLIIGKPTVGRKPVVWASRGSARVRLTVGERKPLKINRFVLAVHAVGTRKNSV